MREINRDEGKVYSIEDKFFLEKIYEDLDELIDDEKYIKAKCKKNGFKVLKYSWSIQDNPKHLISKLFDPVPKSEAVSPINFLFKLTLKYK
tara:strand:- start:294 stop:566 length:273 start_codon:yes stop_codon:yes gene_type:complete